MLRFKMMVLFAVCIAVGNAGAQDLSHYLTPYGFRLPQLERGEYVLSATGNFYASDYKSIRQEAADYGWEDEYRQYVVNFSATCALTDQLLVQGGIGVSPSYRSDRTKNWGHYSLEPDSIVRETIEGNLKASVQPSLTIVFRPQPTLEIFVSGELMTRNVDVTYDRVTDPWDDKRQEQDSKYLYFGITYLGKL